MWYTEKMVNGNTRYSIKDIAKLSGVSTATLSRYFNGQGVKASTERKIQTVIKETGYIPNIAARFMKGQRTGIIGLILPQLDHYFFSEIAEGVIEEARRNGMAVLCGSCEGSKKIEKQIIEQFSHSILDGLIYIPVAQAEDIPAIEQFRNLPMVVVARRNLFPGIPHIYHDGEKGGYLATKYLIQLGRKNIVFVASFWNAPCATGNELLTFLDDPRSGSFSSCDRLRGYIKALKAEGIPINPNNILISSYWSKSGIEVAKIILGKMEAQDGIILMDQTIASGCVEELQEQGITVPENISIVIFDDNNRNSAYNFSKVDLQLENMGIQAIKTLRDEIEGRSTTDRCLDVTFSPGKSTTKKK